MHALPNTEILDWMLSALHVACEVCGDGVHPLEVIGHRKTRRVFRARSVWGQLVRRRVRMVDGVYRIVFGSDIKFGNDYGLPISFPTIAAITGKNHSTWLLSIRNREFADDVARCEAILERQHVEQVHAGETKLRWLQAEG